MNDYRCLTILTIRANSSYPGCSYVSSLARWSGPEVRAVDKRISSLSSHSVAWSVSVCYTALRTDYSQAPSLLSFLSALGPRSADSLAMAYDCLTPPLSSLLLLPPEPPFAPTVAGIFAESPALPSAEKRLPLSKPATDTLSDPALPFAIHDRNLATKATYHYQEY